MCGIAGFVYPPGMLKPDEVRSLTESMTRALRHRGPDDSGQWHDNGSGVALGFRRLAIVDLSIDGHQPMCSPSERFVMVFNGEVYNAPALRCELGEEHGALAERIRGHSDTAVMLAAFDRWGIEEAVQRFTGMFAFAVWDRMRQTMTLGRDRLGEKPLYYAQLGDTIAFASELKSLRQLPKFNPALNLDAVSLLLRRTFIPAPYTIYQDVSKLLSGTLLTIEFDHGAHSWRKAEPHAYWSVQDAALAGLTNPFDGADADAIDHLERLLSAAIRQQMVADVPVGAFLSGGIDSSLVVALMQAVSKRPVRSFSIGFDHASLNEAPHAKKVATHLCTDHHELYVSDKDARDVIPLLPRVYDEPFADSSQIPTYLVSRMARNSVTVSLTGDGSDELFGGYNSYFRACTISRLINRVGLLRRPLAFLLGNAPGPVFDQVSRLERRLGLRGNKQQITAARVRKLATTLSNASSPLRLYQSMIEQPTPPLAAGLSRTIPLQPRLPNEALRSHMTSLQLMTYFDQVGALSDDMLTKVDRASMAVSLETRTPFLDHRVVEFSWRLNDALKVHDGRGKWILRQVLFRHVPRELIERPKQGFAIPVGEWLRGPLREWAEDLISPGRLRAEGLLCPDAVHRIWGELLESDRTAAPQMWSILMLQSWLDEQKG